MWVPFVVPIPEPALPLLCCLRENEASSLLTPPCRLLAQKTSPGPGFALLHTSGLWINSGRLAMSQIESAARIGEHSAVLSGGNGDGPRVFK